MSQKDGFAGGFLTGAIFGGVIGGVVGAIVANRTTLKKPTNPNKLETSDLLKLGTEEEMEIARRNLENKIAQLNCAIDDVRQQLEPTGSNHLEREEN